MDYSYVFKSGIPQYDKFESFGFKRKGSVYTLEKPLKTPGFSALIHIENERITAEVYEEDTKYDLFDVKSAKGSFVYSIREQVKALVDDFASCCIQTEDVRQKYVDYIKKAFGVEPDYPFNDSKYSPCAVFRCPNKKWFGIMMEIKYKNIGLDSDEPVDMVNLKADSNLMDSIVDHRSIFPAYHMNKRHWITVLLTKATDFDKLCSLTSRSFELVGRKAAPKEIK